tara:strand:- start:164 stop:361 length:198 start_codon:yes stop_codon:yes gene_type:complete
MKSFGQSQNANRNTNHSKLVLSKIYSLAIQEREPQEILQQIHEYRSTSKRKPRNFHQMKENTDAT